MKFLVVKSKEIKTTILKFYQKGVIWMVSYNNNNSLLQALLFGQAKRASRDSFHSPK